MGDDFNWPFLIGYLDGILDSADRGTVSKDSLGYAAAQLRDACVSLGIPEEALMSARLLLETVDG